MLSPDRFTRPALLATSRVMAGATAQASAGDTTGASLPPQSSSPYHDHCYRHPHDSSTVSGLLTHTARQLSAWDGLTPDPFARAAAGVVATSASPSPRISPSYATSPTAARRPTPIPAAGAGGAGEGGLDRSWFAATAVEPRTVPRPDDSAQVLGCLQSPLSPRAAATQAAAGVTTTRNLPKPCMLNDFEYAQQRRMSPPPSPKRIRGMSLELELEQDTQRADKPQVSAAATETVGRFHKLNVPWAPEAVDNDSSQQQRSSSPPPPTRHHRQGLFEWESHEEVLDTRRVGEIGSVLNAVKPKYAIKGFVKSNLPTLEGVRGLGSLNASLKPIPEPPPGTHPTARLHPTYLNTHQIRMADDHRIGNILQSLRDQSHRPTLRYNYVQNGQGTAAEIARERMLAARRERQENRMRRVERQLYSPVKTPALQKKLDAADRGAAAFQSGLWDNM